MSQFLTTRISSEISPQSPVLCALSVGRFSITSGFGFVRSPELEFMKQVTPKYRAIRVFGPCGMTWAVTVLFLVFIAISTAEAVTIDMVNVGNAGNAPDTRYNSTAVGSVPYSYRIGKYEITAGQYTEFLNAVAGEDANGLYNLEMDPIWPTGPHIEQTGSSPNYSYSVGSDWANRPVNSVNFWDAV